MVKAGGCTTSLFWGSFYAAACSFSHIERGGGRKKVPLFKGGAWGGGAQTVLDLRFSHFVASPSP